MRAELFYQLSSKKTAIPIELVTFEAWSSLEAQYQQALTWQNFAANLGETLLILNREGSLERVLLGVAKQQYYSALAIAALKLPSGLYRLEHPCSSYDLLAWAAAQYRFIRYKSMELKPRVLVLDEAVYTEVSAFADAVFKVRDLINTPAEDMGPQDLSISFESLAQRFQARFSAIIGDDLLQENFPAIHTVGRAATQAPRLLKLDWGNPKHPFICLIGKGVCFDSGGMDLKTATGMRYMKKDMGGAAQVLGLAQLLMQMNLPIRLQILVPAVENAIDAKAYRPGDIIRMRNGLHVEIENTDAEGRLVLADAISYACEQKPDLILDFATLTGAARVALGTEISGLFSNNNELAQSLQKIGEQTYDTVWPMPLYRAYASMLDSNFADLQNASTSSYAGAITAALFLERFVTEHMDWGHFDLMAWNVANKPGKPEGGEAMAMLTVFEYLRRRFGQS